MHTPLEISQPQPRRGVAVQRKPLHKSGFQTAAARLRYQRGHLRPRWWFLMAFQEQHHFLQACAKVAPLYSL